MKMHSLRVIKKIQETADTVSLVFEIPADLKEEFRFKSGQFLTLVFTLEDEEYRRSYSISSAPSEAEIKVSCKRLEGGKISNHIVDNVQEDERVKVLVPDGKFVFIPEESSTRDLYFFAAGSGITPIMSMIKTALEEEPKSTCHLLYGNRTEEDIIFYKELSALQQKYAGQLIVEHTLSKQKKGGVMSIFTKKTKWQGEYGRIDNQKIRKLLERTNHKYSQKKYFICGPNDMTDDTIEALIQLGVDANECLREYFFIKKESQNTEKNVDSNVEIWLDGKEISLTLSTGKTILDALLDADHDPPYSCTSGACSSCIAKLKKGKVNMDDNHSLDESEVADGYILTCQATPESEHIVIEFED